ncbi:hypothetical protein [Paludisphaera mucosa]|uniref:Uncharacterized protein n=1 Tax=Paludisphaera mucosa TaxID=3030827 RepID=A0ABT6F3R9_9BACT|nr:hypothetical protein [Paludisphaera mucosa]MDG3002159.1 hypothetical protein [Paludisphaera mucosa]
MPSIHDGFRDAFVEESPNAVPGPKEYRDRPGRIAIAIESMVANYNIMMIYKKTVVDSMDLDSMDATHGVGRRRGLRRGFGGGA